MESTECFYHCVFSSCHKIGKEEVQDEVSPAAGYLGFGYLSSHCGTHEKRNYTANQILHYKWINSPTLGLKVVFKVFSEKKYINYGTTFKKYIYQIES